MFSAGGRRNELREAYANVNFPEAERLNDVLGYIRSTVTDDKIYQHYETAVAEMKKSYGMVYRQALQSFEPADIFVWLYRLSDGFLNLLKERAQEALVIFAFYCVIPKRLESNWWIEGWSAHLMSRIFHVLDQEHRLWIRWPIEEM